MPDKTTKHEETHILKAHKEIFTEMILHPEDYVLISCFYDGQPSVAIARVIPEGDDAIIYPLFLTVPKDAIITGHDGEEAQGFDWQGFNDEQCDSTTARETETFDKACKEDCDCTHGLECSDPDCTCGEDDDEG